MVGPFQVVRDFEKALAEYTGAPYAVAVDSCTNAILLCCSYYRVGNVEIPSRTYVGVAMSIIHAGGRVKFRDEEWGGIYRLEPYPIFDAARRFRRNMYIPHSLMCVSFHWQKILGIGRGGAILTDSPKAVEWLRRARFDGREEGIPPKDDKFPSLGWHFYMTPELAAAGLVRLSFLPDTNPDLPCDDYPDLSLLEIFRKEEGKC